MPRPRKRRRVGFKPRFLFFKPRGVPLRDLSSINLRIEELEALRLKHKQELSQEEAAERMEVSRTTFARTLKQAHQKVTDFLLGGSALSVEEKPSSD